MWGWNPFSKINQFRDALAKSVAEYELFKGKIMTDVNQVSTGLDGLLAQLTTLRTLADELHNALSIAQNSTKDFATGQALGEMLAKINAAREATAATLAADALAPASTTTTADTAGSEVPTGAAAAPAVDPAPAAAPTGSDTPPAQ